MRFKTHAPIRLASSAKDEPMHGPLLVEYVPNEIGPIEVGQQAKHQQEYTKRIVHGPLAI